MRQLTVYYDGQCSLCCHIQSWLSSEPQIIPILFVDRHTEDARAVYALTEGLKDQEDLVALVDTGNLWAGDGAWLMVLYALEGYRGWSFRLAEPRYRPLLHRIICLLSEHRFGISRWLEPTPATVEITASRAEALDESSPFCPSTDHPRTQPSDSGGIRTKEGEAP